MIEVNLKRTTGDFGFEVLDSNNHILNTDSSSENGGQDSGFRPMQLLLAAFGSCAAIDIVSILKKQKQEIENFHMLVSGEREEGIPALWKTAHVHFTLSGPLDREKVERAAKLSIEKYCSVAETLRRGGTLITYSVETNISKPGADE